MLAICQAWWCFVISSAAQQLQLQFLLSMEGFTAGVLLSLLVTAASGAPVTCSSEGVECEVGEDNLIDAVMHVMTLEECRLELQTNLCEGFKTLC